MRTPHKKQNFQDWITQQWVILFGRSIGQKENEWLCGPFGNTNGIGLKFVEQLAEKEQLVIERHKRNTGLIQSIHQLSLPEADLNALSRDVKDFYEKTADYDFELDVKWNPFFKFFGVLLRLLFSNRIEQLNVPIKNHGHSKALTSEIIHLTEPETKEIKRTIWLRTFQATGQVVYSGIYGTCVIPSGQTCIKAIFPLPNGNATVILAPQVGKNGELMLRSSGEKFGDSGFYFLLEDSKGCLWSKFVSSFKDELVVRSERNCISAVQTLTLWGMNVLRFEYKIAKQIASDLP